MVFPGTPDNEKLRLATLQATGLLDSKPEATFDRITRLASRMLDVPVALVSLVDKDRQWFKSKQGIDASETPREISFCGHAILGEELFEIEDATQDKRFSDNPLVKEDPSIRFYAGAPLRYPNGTTLGTLCVIDRKPRKLTDAQRESLRDLALLVEKEIRESVALRYTANERAALKSFLDSAEELVQSVTPEGKILFVNQAWLDKLGYTEEEAQKMSVFDVIDPECMDDCMGMFKRVMSGERLSNIKAIFRTREGRRLFVSGNANCDFQDGKPVHTRAFFRDVTHEHSIETELRRLFDLSVDLICTAGFDGFFKELSPSWTETLGFSVEELKSRPFVEFIHPEDREATTKEAARLSEGGETVEFRNRYRRKDGSYIWLEWRAKSLPETKTIYCIATNVTRRVELERRRRELISTVNHDLKNPVASMLMVMELLQLPEYATLTPDAAEVLNKGRSNGKYMLGLIDEFLAQEKWESGRTEYKSEEFDVSQLASDCLGLVRLGADRREISLHESLGNSLKAKGDPRRVRQVMMNLLSNALKYTGNKGEVRVSVETRNGSTRFEVKDSGRGIAETDREKIFKRFSQVDPEKDSEIGTGLGLSIAQEMVETMGGKIDFESEVGKGSTFFFELPR